MPNRRHNSREYGTNQPSYTNTHTQYPNNVAANETYDNDHHYTNPDAHYTYEPIQSRHNVNTGYTFTHDHPGTQGYAATGQQGRSTGDHEPMAYQQPPYQQQANYGFVDQQQETFHQPSADEHQPTEEQQPRHQQQPTHRQDSAGQQRKPSYQSSAYEHQPTEQQQLMGHDEPHRYTESPSTQQTDTYTPPSTIDLSTGPAHSVTPTPRTWTGSSLDVNIPESVYGSQELTTTSEMTSGGGSSHECYPPSPESYACDDPAPASTTTQPGECDTDRTGDFVADRQLSFERHEQYGYAPVRASIRRVADRRRDIRQIELAQARAVRDAKRDRGQRSGGSGKGTGNK